MLLLGSALALSLERICYVWVSRAPGQFRALCARRPRSRFADPVVTLSALCVAFKAIQALVFAVWWVARGSVFSTVGLHQVVVGSTLVIAGQALNLTVFGRLGVAGVFYGAQFGHDVGWCRGFPFSLVAHPQYVGATLTIWGAFLVAAYPSPGWYVLPVVETVYYALGATLER